MRSAYFELLTIHNSLRKLKKVMVTCVQGYVQGSMHRKYVCG